MYKHMTQTWSKVTIMAAQKIVNHMKFDGHHFTDFPGELRGVGIMAEAVESEVVESDHINKTLPGVT